jgi:hypothetical protein
LESKLAPKELIFLTGVNSGISEGVFESGGFADYLFQKGMLATKMNQRPKKVVCIDYSDDLNKQIRTLGITRANCALIRMEPSVVLPANYDKSRVKEFAKIISVGGIPGSDYYSMGWPLSWPDKEVLRKTIETKRLDKTVLVNGNKISFIKGELYALRRKAIREIKNLDLYGTNWNSGIVERTVLALKALAVALLSRKFPNPKSLKYWFGRYPNYLGKIEDKVEVMSSYETAVVIENSAEYMSEKLFDAFFAGCMPIYVGPDVGLYGIPSKLVFRAEPSVKGLMDALEKARNANHDVWKQELLDFLFDPRTINTWRKEEVYSSMLEIIKT